MKSVIELLNAIRHNPGIIEKNSLEYLQSFLHGWNYRRPDEDLDGNFSVDFRAWVQKSYGIVDNKHSWSDIIRFFEKGHDELNIFFRVFDRWEKERHTNTSANKMSTENSAEINSTNTVYNVQGEYPASIRTFPLYSMDSVIELLNFIEPRPALYIKKNSITCLKAFIEGWGLRDLVALKKDGFREKFEGWIEERSGISDGHTWNEIILFYSNDESHALSNFFTLFNEWKKEKGN